MSRLTLAAVAAALTVCAAPAAVAAQEAAQNAAAAEAAPAPSPEEAAFQAKGQAFQAATQRMGGELEAVMQDEALDAATKKARTDAIITQYEPAFAAFADDMAVFFRLMADKPEHADEKEQILAAAEAAPAQIRTLPAQIRASIDQALAAEAAAPAAD